MCFLNEKFYLLSHICYVKEKMWIAKIPIGGVLGVMAAYQSTDCTSLLGKVATLAPERKNKLCASTTMCK